MIKMIWAEDINHGIAKDGKIPWNLKEDLSFFKNTTINNIVVMGRSTWESLKYRPLKNRINYILTKNTNLEINVPDTYVISDIYAILELNHTYPNKDIFIIGGKQIYDVFFQYADELIVTVIKKDYHCDLILNYNLSDFMLIETKKHEGFDIKIYKRK